MSICYWGVVGYGIKISEEMFDIEKLSNLNEALTADSKYDNDDEFWECNCLECLIDNIAINTQERSQGSFHIYA